MKNNHLNHNKQFLVGVSFLAIGVIVIVIIFIMLGFRMQAAKNSAPKYNEIYNITLSKGFKGDSIAVYINDSLLYDNLVTTDSLTLKVDKLDEQNALIVHTKKDDHATTFNLEEKGGRVVLNRSGQLISITTTAWE